ncbi:MAG: cytochrome c biogenesis protein CcdC [Gemmatimonadaceae bacterium]|nr:cytochrome c biogenesis protein CcdC [Gemmatimonadaceae bacterium]
MSLQDLYAHYAQVLRPILRIAPVFGGVAMLAWRVRETRVPVSAKAIVIPPLAMSSGFVIFAMPMARVPWTWALGAFLLGCFVLSYPLTRSTRLEPRDGVIYMQRSRAFLAILLALLAVRLLLHDYIGHLISPLQTASLFFLLAFGMIARWRWVMYGQFRALTETQVVAPRRDDGAGVRRGAMAMRAMTILTILGILVALLIPVIASRRARATPQAPAGPAGPSASVSRDA